MIKQNRNIIIEDIHVSEILLTTNAFVDVIKVNGFKF